jgi:hypothetical protein
LHTLVLFCVIDKHKKLQIQQLQTSQTLLKQQKIQNAEVELNFKIQSEGLVKQYRSKLQQADSSLREAKAVVQEFITFTVVRQFLIL